MKVARFVGLSLILIGALVLAQSGRAPLGNQPNGLPNLTQVSQVAHFVHRGPRELRAAAPRPVVPPASGLNFADPVDYGSGGYWADSVAIADVNGDGKPDLIVANQCVSSGSCSTSGGSVGVLLGNGDGTFQTALTYSSGGDIPHSVAVADVNGDGKMDLLVANYCGSESCTGDGTIGVLLGNGDGTFQTAVTYGSGGYNATSVAVADVNRDGKLDLVVANACGSSNCSSGTVGVLLGNGDGAFQTAVTYGLNGYWAASVAIADLNGDGNPDLVVGNCSQSACQADSWVQVLLGNGDGTFGKAVTYDSGGGYDAVSVAVADVNQDGRPDIVAANQCVSSNSCYNSSAAVLLGNGDGTFKKAVAYASGGALAGSLVVADVNGDGKLDVVVANECPNGNNCGGDGSAGVLLGNGDGTFQPAATFDASLGPVSIAVADVNGDGKPDVVVADECTSSNNCRNGSVGVLINTSLTGTTTTLTSSPNPSKFGQTVTFTATVTAQPGFDKGTPTGAVTFYDGTTNIGSANLNGSGVAVLKTSKLPVGTDSMTATYNGDANFYTSTSPVLNQVVKGAVASISPASLDFGNQTVDIASAPKDVTLTNTGNIDLTITSIAITGADGGDFSQDNNCPSSLGPNHSCKINVVFTPTTTGKRTAALQIADNAPGSPQKVSLSGVGVLPATSFSPTSLTFPVQLVFTDSKPQSVTLTNTGLGVLLISKITVTGQFSQKNDCPSQLKPNDKCTIQVTFDPQTKGIQNGSINVADNAPGSPQQVPLTGTCTYIQLAPAKVNFGTQPVGTKSLPKKITLTNKGDAAVNISSITITGTDAGDFAETNNCGHQVASGASCFIKVTFKPLEKGETRSRCFRQRQWRRQPANRVAVRNGNLTD
jgi:hypothetical protein